MKTRLLKPVNSIIASLFITGILVLLFGSEAKSQVVNGVDYTDRASVYSTFDILKEDVLGQRFLPEHYTYIDEVTGVEIIALTTSRNKNSKIYQTHPQWTPDGKYIVFKSDRGSGRNGENKKNLAYAISMETYEIVQVSTGKSGSNLHLGWKKNSAYFFRDNALVELKLGNLLADSEAGKVKDSTYYEQVLGIVPDDIKPSGMGLDAEENRVFFSSRINDKKSALYSIDFKSGKTKKLLEVPFRIGHLQSNPYVSGEVMYCWETGGDSPQRMWYMSVDKKENVTNKPIYAENDKEWVTHEIFMGPDHILFNIIGHLDRLRDTPTGIVSVNIRTDESIFHGQRDDIPGGYWHCDGTTDLQWAVGDTFNGNLYRLSLQDKDDVKLLTTGHRLDSKSPFGPEAHSHHSISPDGKWVLFNSSMLTDSDIMLVRLHPE